MCSATLFPDPESPLTMGFEDFLGVMVGSLFLVLLDAAVELVGERVDGGIHILLSGIGVDFIAAHHQGGFGFVSHFFYSQHAVDVDELLEMPRDALKFLEHVAAQRGGDFHMMTAEI